MKDLAKIIKKHPSICYSCTKARKPAADANRNKGYVGCCLGAMVKGMRRDGETAYYDFIEIQEAREVGEGWVDLRAAIDGDNSGIIANLQILTLEVTKCNQYENKII